MNSEVKICDFKGCTIYGRSIGRDLRQYICDQGHVNRQFLPRQSQAAVSIHATCEDCNNAKKTLTPVLSSKRVVRCAEHNDVFDDTGYYLSESNNYYKKIA
ncbi:hypothetical protein O181_040255 [Austropuccinia psidii MF-1]|uniref:Uncharacterized protein n=1 Tax=Austropuccinia psidii MF-1 TaxID=1389203 RepID=A0A9Q3DGE0_9BASI|nr:hypothetical protein [Austropuccinia psidii MF-1]